VSKNILQRRAQTANPFCVVGERIAKYASLSLLNPNVRLCCAAPSRGPASPAASSSCGSAPPGRPPAVPRRRGPARASAAAPHHRPRHPAAAGLLTPPRAGSELLGVVRASHGAVRASCGPAARRGGRERGAVGGDGGRLGARQGGKQAAHAVICSAGIFLGLLLENGRFGCVTLVSCVTQMEEWVSDLGGGVACWRQYEEERERGRKGWRKEVRGRGEAKVRGFSLPRFAGRPNFIRGAWCSVCSRLRNRDRSPCGAHATSPFRHTGTNLVASQDEDRCSHAQAS
jgi:hypothetical protein